MQAQNENNVKETECLITSFDRDNGSIAILRSVKAFVISDPVVRHNKGLIMIKMSFVED